MAMKKPDKLKYRCESCKHEMQAAKIPERCPECGSRWIVRLMK